MDRNAWCGCRNVPPFMVHVVSFCAGDAEMHSVVTAPIAGYADGWAYVWEGVLGPVGLCRRDRSSGTGLLARSGRQWWVDADLYAM